MLLDVIIPLLLRVSLLQCCTDILSTYNNLDFQKLVVGFIEELEFWSYAKKSQSYPLSPLADVICLLSHI